MDLESLPRRVEVGDCWLWTMSRFRNGYAQVWHEGTNHGAHRVVWELLVGPIPEGATLDHLCKVKHCVNPDHLEPVSQAENHRRGAQREVARQRGYRRYCPKGHDTWVTGRYRSSCIPCKREYDREYRLRRQLAD